jgi:hypothetical protein
MLEKARALGRAYGKAKASWAIEPERLSKVQMQAILDGIEDVDPLIMNQFKEPDLSGEYSDSPTPERLVNELEFDEDSGQAGDIEAICEAWKEAARDTFWSEIQKTLLHHTED